MLKDFLKFKGEITLQRYKQGELIEEFTQKNLIVNVGLAAMVNRLLASPTTNAVSHMALGTNAVAAAATDTSLGAESGRVAMDSTVIETTTITNDTIKFTATFPEGVATAALNEAGLFNAASVGDMYARSVFGTVTKSADDVIVVTWKFTIS